MKNISTIFITSLLSGVITLGAYKLVFEDNSGNLSESGITTEAPLHQVSYNGYNSLDFTQGVDKAINTVVHVKNVSYHTVRNPIMEFFYGYQSGQPREQVGTGSGVIISEDGYVVTNNHVIRGASEIDITLNDNRTFPAKLIGTDSKMDIALLKIDADEKFPYAVFADSDNIKVGEWVLAIGNPYNLNSTVTAGIVSAKARNLATSGIQSFIQTDAAVNPGNSGGALVNTNGDLIGINTMISSNTGSYVGYSFAVPSNITRKIVEDLMEFGKVQQGILGVQGFEINSQIAEKLDLKTTQGFYVNDVSKNTGAEKAGVKEGDVITQIDDRSIRSFSDLNAVISTKRPNDKVTALLNRNGKPQSIEITLTNKELMNIKYKGFELENLSDREKSKHGIDYGIKINNITNPRFKPYENELKNAIVIGINGSKVEDIESANKLLNHSADRIRLDIITSNGERVRLML
ncbi:Do family serine endopeptidase [Avrilella dinanensis]|uniref:Serine protease n=1 Tax=Avrilella dinanensis TaxID=2008672 RepID=A0A2M9R7L6_9FLAO|nr:Do family serine endopeptidase [Avrilella dinanensis]PJR04862.1 serine protease [Avrilella dinanensis]